MKSSPSQNCHQKDSEEWTINEPGIVERRPEDYEVPQLEIINDEDTVNNNDEKEREGELLRNVDIEQLIKDNRIQSNWGIVPGEA